MTGQIEGTFQGEVITQFHGNIPDKPLHVLAMATIAGVQSSADELWNDAKLTYWSMGDLLDGEGKVSGYFHNKHVNGGTTFGSFEADVTMNSGQSSTVGKWQLINGTGRFAGITGGGRFDAQSDTPVTVSMTWSGEISLPD